MSATLAQAPGGARPFADYVALSADAIRERTWAAKRALGVSAPGMCERTFGEWSRPPRPIA